VIMQNMYDVGYNAYMSSVADRIRVAAAVRVRQARETGESTVAIRAGDIVRELHLKNQTPSVCSALASRRFLDENHIKLERRDGPPSGQSTTSLFTYRICDNQHSEAVTSKFHALRGAAKEAFRELGGGEEFLAREREVFHTS
jgi:hypothetical protein